MAIGTSSRGRPGGGGVTCTPIDRAELRSPPIIRWVREAATLVAILGLVALLLAGAFLVLGGGEPNTGTRSVGASPMIPVGTLGHLVVYFLVGLGSAGGAGVGLWLYGLGERAHGSRLKVIGGLAGVCFGAPAACGALYCAGGVVYELLGLLYR